MPSSRSSTFVRCLRNPGDRRAWNRFDSLYRPMIEAFSRALGVDHASSEEIAQQTLVAAFEGFSKGNFVPDRGSVKGWLLGIVRHKIADFRAEQTRRPVLLSQRSSIAAQAASCSDPATLSRVWEDEWRAVIIRECFRSANARFSSRDIRVFKLLRVDGRSPEEVAKTVGMSRAAVYKVKHRVLTYMDRVRCELEENPDS